MHPLVLLLVLCTLLFPTVCASPHPHTDPVPRRPVSAEPPPPLARAPDTHPAHTAATPSRRHVPTRRNQELPSAPNVTFELVQALPLCQQLAPACVDRDLAFGLVWNTADDFDIEVYTELASYGFSTAAQRECDPQDPHLVEASIGQSQVYLVDVRQYTSCLGATATAFVVVLIEGSPTCRSSDLIFHGKNDGVWQELTVQFPCLRPEEHLKQPLLPPCSAQTLECEGTVSVKIEWTSFTDIDLYVLDKAQQIEYASTHPQLCGLSPYSFEQLSFDGTTSQYDITVDVVGDPDGCQNSTSVPFVGTVAINGLDTCILFPNATVQDVHSATTSFSCTAVPSSVAPTPPALSQIPAPPPCIKNQIAAADLPLTVSLFWDSRDDIDLAVQLSDSAADNQITSSNDQFCDTYSPGREDIHLGYCSENENFTVSTQLVNLCPQDDSAKEVSTVFFAGGRPVCSGQPVSMDDLRRDITFTVLYSCVNIGRQNYSSNSAPSPSPSDSTTSPGQSGAPGEPPSPTVLLNPPSPSVSSKDPTPIMSPSPSDVHRSGSRGEACFPGDAYVRLWNGENTPMKKLALGSKIQHGQGQYSDMYFFGHKDMHASYAFLRIESDHANISLSSQHYIWANGRLKLAQDLNLGDKLTIVLEQGPSFSSSVTRITQRTAKGLFNPHTLSGNLVVNSVLVSAYTAAVPPRVGHALLWPARQAYRFFSLTIPGNTFEYGIRAYCYTQFASLMSALR